MSAIDRGAQPNWDNSSADVKSEFDTNSGRAKTPFVGFFPGAYNALVDRHVRLRICRNAKRTSRPLGMD
jgi:hypothetical protein